MALRAKDIAEMLGVSTATVSLVLNNKPGVGEKRRQEIIQKIILNSSIRLLIHDIPGTSVHLAEYGTSTEEE